MKMVGCRVFLLFVGAAVLSGISASKCDGQGALPSSKELYYSCQEVARKVSTCRIVVANRGSHSKLGGKFDTDPSSVLFCDCWMDGDALCVRELRVDGQPQGPAWSDGFSWPDSPYSEGTIDEDVKEPSSLNMWRREGDPQFVVFGPTRKGEEVYSGYYDTQPSAQLACPALAPLLAINRAWAGHETLLDRILLTTTAEDWVVTGEEFVQDQRLIKVRVEAGIREKVTERGKLGIGQVYYLWCDPAHHLLPVRAISVVEYLVGGKWFPNNGPDGSAVFSAEYSVHEFVEFAGVEYPVHGVDKQFTPDVERISDIEPFDPEALIAQVIETGAYVSTGIDKEFAWEWKVLHLAEIDPGIDLWVDPPDGVVLVAGKDVRIAGRSVEDSRVLLGKMPPNMEADVIRETKERYRRNLRVAVAVNIVLAGAAAAVWFRRRNRDV